MLDKDALLLALKGVPISHKGFKDKSRFISCTKIGEDFVLIDSAFVDSRVDWKSLTQKYGKEGWKKHSNGEKQDEISLPDFDSQNQVFLDFSYLSDQLEEVTELLEKVLNFADKRVKKNDE